MATKHSVTAHQISAAEELWSAPLDGPFEVQRHFELKNGPYRAGHRGIDLPGRSGDVVRAPASGTVTFVGVVVDRPSLTIRVNSQTVYSVEPVSTELRTGDAVARGEPVGVVSAGGHCDDGCLHLGVRVNQQYVNPIRYFRSRAELVPW